LQNQRKIKESFEELTLNHWFLLALSQYPGKQVLLKPETGGK
jgi:hypothetical protein